MAFGVKSTVLVRILSDSRSSSDRKDGIPDKLKCDRILGNSETFNELFPVRGS